MSKGFYHQCLLQSVRFRAKRLRLKHAKNNKNWHRRIARNIHRTWLFLMFEKSGTLLLVLLRI